MLGVCSVVTVGEQSEVLYLCLIRLYVFGVCSAVTVGEQGEFALKSTKG